MKKKLTLVLVALFCICAPAGAGAAVEDLKVGAALTYGSDSDFGVGARVEYPLEEWVPNLGIAGGLNVFFPRDPYTGWWEVNAAALYHFDVSDTFIPYAGAGLAFASWKRRDTRSDFFGVITTRDNSSDSSFLLNAIGGCSFEFDLGFTPFVEARIGLGGGNGLEITAGALIGF